MATPLPDDDAALDAAIVAQVQESLCAAPVTPAYRAALTAALALPGNILSATPNARWAQPVCACCRAAGGGWMQAVPMAAAVEVFMVALDLLDDAEDGENTPLYDELGAGRTLNASTGLLFLAHHALLRAEDGAQSAALLLEAGLRACSGQHADLAPAPEQPRGLDEALAITAGKSASLGAVACRLGAVAAGADAARQTVYARFGWYLGMVAQLANDLAAIRPGVTGKTDLALRRPMLPLTYAALLAASRGGPGHDPAGQTALWTGGPAQLTWAVAETYRLRALALIPQLSADPVGRADLAGLLHASEPEVKEG